MLKHIAALHLRTVRIQTALAERYTDNETGSAKLFFLLGAGVAVVIATAVVFHQPEPKQTFDMMEGTLP
jgi:hypothetical protein